MKVLLISANTEEINMRALPWGMGCVASASRRAAHDVLLLDLLTERNPNAAVARAIGEFSPEVIGISVRNIDDQNRKRPNFFLEKVKETVEECRRHSRSPLVLGGAGYSIFPQSALEFLGADVGIQGEGEYAFPMLLDRLEHGTGLDDVPGVHLPGEPSRGDRHFVGDLTSLPLPGDDILTPYSASRETTWIPVQARRGCAMNCSYCSTGVIEGRVVRVRSAEQVVDWVARCAGAGFRKFFFVDNAFNIPPSLGRDICMEMSRKALDVTWRCILNPWRVEEDLVGAMADAGCVEVSLGFESGCEQILRMMNKKFTVDQVRKASSLLAAHGITRRGFLLLGGPGETKESVEESLAFADSLNLEALRVTAGIRIYPGTRLAQTAVEEGLIRSDDDLLHPAFYIQRDIEEWLDATLEKWSGSRPNWVF
jgi:radical SAM superfamily enzyme YgiQ (UPF0313 family)